MLREMSKELCMLGNEVERKILIAKAEITYMEKSRMNKLADRQQVLWYNPSKREFKIFEKSLEKINNESENLEFFIDSTNKLIGMIFKER